MADRRTHLENQPSFAGSLWLNSGNTLAREHVRGSDIHVTCLVAGSDSRMGRPIYRCSLVVWAMATAACGHARESTVSAATSVDTPPTAVTQTAGGMEHGDHNPHHGGVVYMYDDMHYEVVLDPAGHHRIYFSDAARADLPASAASGVTLTLERAQAPAETVAGVIDEQGESWVLEGTPVRQRDTSVRVSFVAHGTPYWIDVPFIPSAQ